MLIYMNKTLALTYKSLKTKEKWSWSLMGAESYESFSLQGLGHLFKPVFIKVVITRAGCLREWSQGQLRLYFVKLPTICV